MDNNEKKEISLIGRLISMETVIVLAGVASLGYGIVNGTLINIFWGVIILVGAVVLSFVRKKDWKKHWEEQERMKQAYLELERRKREEKSGRKE